MSKMVPQVYGCWTNGSGRMVFVLLHLFSILVLIGAPHYKGGTITWKPLDRYTNSSMVTILISQSHWWTRFYYPCDQNLIDNLGWYNDVRDGMVIWQPWVDCVISPAICASFGYTYILERTYCTDFSPLLDLSSGSSITRRTISRNTDISVGYVSGAWADEIKTTSGVAAVMWNIITRINLSVKYPINSSPVTGSLPIIRVIENEIAVIQVPRADWDLQDDLRCRWASSTGAAGNECGDICLNMPGATIGLRDCTINWYAVRRPIDVLNNLNTSTYVAAIMVEDFANTTSTVPMSSVPLQMLIFVYQRPAGACSIKPAIIGDRPNRACIGVPINVTLTERIVGTVYCDGDWIQEFVTFSPMYMKKTALAPVPGTTRQWFITLTWMPRDDQIGPQVFCVAPIDNRGLTGAQHCVNFVVGYSAPNLIPPLLVQGSASPLGTVFSNHSIFSIQTTGYVYKPNRNGTYIQIFKQANSSMPEWEIDCGYSSDCIYSGKTVLFVVRNASWTYGAHYYVLFSSGAASGNVFCAPESAPITDPNFWTFNIWDPGFSSTTSTTTTPPTVGTVTTRGIATTTPNVNLTTTGVIITSSTTVTTTTTTTTTSTTTTTVTAVTQTTTVTDMDVLTPKEMEEQCQQPIVIVTAAMMATMAAVHVTGMFTVFIKIDKKLNPNRLAAKAREQRYFQQITRPPK